MTDPISFRIEHPDWSGIVLITSITSEDDIGHKGPYRYRIEGMAAESVNDDPVKLDFTFESPESIEGMHITDIRDRWLIPHLAEKKRLGDFMASDFYKWGLKKIGSA